MICVLSIVTACTGVDQRQTVDGTEGRTAPGGGGDQLCDGFSRSEIENLLGAPVILTPRPDEKAMCYWEGTGAEDAAVQTHVIRNREAWTPPHGAKGYELLTGIGERAYVVPELGGWAAAALTEEGMVAVWMAGGKADRESAIQLLRSALDRQ
jgi:hypothetical protein